MAQALEGLTHLEDRLSHLDKIDFKGKKFIVHVIDTIFYIEPHPSVQEYKFLNEVFSRNSGIAAFSDLISLTLEDISKKGKFYRNIFIHESSRYKILKLKVVNGTREVEVIIPSLQLLTYVSYMGLYLKYKSGQRIDYSFSSMVNAFNAAIKNTTTDSPHIILPYLVYEALPEEKKNSVELSSKKLGIITDLSALEIYLKNGKEKVTLKKIKEELESFGLFSLFEEYEKYFLTSGLNYNAVITENRLETLSDALLGNRNPPEDARGEAKLCSVDVLDILYPVYSYVGERLDEIERSGGSPGLRLFKSFFKSLINAMINRSSTSENSIVGKVDEDKLIPYLIKGAAITSALERDPREVIKKINEIISNRNKELFGKKEKDLVYFSEAYRIIPISYLSPDAGLEYNAEIKNIIL